LAQAATIRSDLKLRNEAIASMALVDLRVDQQWRENGPVSFYVAFDPLLERYACSSGTGYFSVRRVADHKEILRLPDPGPCWFVYPMFSPDGRYLAIGYYRIQAGNQCVVWDVSRGEKILEPPPPLADAAVHGGCFAFSPDSRQIAVGSPDGRLALFDLSRRKELKRFDAGPQLEKIAFHPDGTQLAVSSRQEQVRIVDIGKEKIVQTFPVPYFTSGLAWSDDGRFLAAGCEDNRIYVWDAPHQRLQAVLEGHQSLPIRLAFNHAGNLLASHS
jgi:WD40 repeat protein